MKQNSSIVIICKTNQSINIEYIVYKFEKVLIFIKCLVVCVCVTVFLMSKPKKKNYTS